MLTIILSAIILGWIGYVDSKNSNYISSDPIDDAIAGTIAGALIGLFFMLFISLAVPDSSIEYTEVDRQELISIEDNYLAVSMLFGGTDKQKYSYYYVENDEALKADWKYAEDSIIFEDEEKQPYVSTLDPAVVGVWRLFTGNIHDNKYEFHIPEGSIVNKFNLDLN